MYIPHQPKQSPSEPSSPSSPAILRSPNNFIPLNSTKSTIIPRNPIRIQVQSHISHGTSLNYKLRHVTKHTIRTIIPLESQDHPIFYYTKECYPKAFAHFSWLLRALGGLPSPKYFGPKGLSEPLPKNCTTSSATSSQTPAVHTWQNSWDYGIPPEHGTSIAG